MLFHLHIKHISNSSTVRKVINEEYSGPEGVQEEVVGAIVEVVPVTTIKILFNF